MAWDARNSWNVDMVQPVNRLCPLNRGLVAWWLGIPGITGGRRSIDITSPGSHGKHGTLTNMDPATAWVASPRGGRAVDIAANSDDWVNCGYSSLWNTLTTSMTLILAGKWVAAGSTRPTSIARFNSGTGKRIWRVGVTVSGEVEGYCDDAGGAYNAAYLTTSAVVYSVGDLFHAALTFSPGRIRLYADGTEVADNGSGPSTLDSTTTQIVHIGGDDHAGILLGQNNWNGLAVNDARIFNRALVASEVKAVYHDSLQGYPRTLRRMGRVIFPAAAPPAGTILPQMIQQGLYAGAN